MPSKWAENCAQGLGGGAGGRKGQVQVAQERLVDILFWLLLSEWEWGHQVSVRQGKKCSRTERRNCRVRGWTSEATALPVLSSPARLPSLASAPSLERGRGERWDIPPFNNCKTQVRVSPLNGFRKLKWAHHKLTLIHFNWILNVFQ